MRERQEADPQRLVCAESGAESDEQAAGWRSLVLSDDDEHPLQDDHVQTWCPVCAAREFDSD